jgi:hypothetical protein
MKSSDKDKYLDQLISRATDDNKNRFIPNFDKWVKDHPVAVQSLNTPDEPVPSERSCRQKGGSHESLWIRFPRLTWACGVAALVLVTVSWSISLVLASKVVRLKHELALARHDTALAQRDVVVARTEGRLEEAHKVRQETTSTISHRVEELEDRRPRISSASRIYYPEDTYYFSNSQGSL